MRELFTFDLPIILKSTVFVDELVGTMTVASFSWTVASTGIDLHSQIWAAIKNDYVIFSSCDDLPDIIWRRWYFPQKSLLKKSSNDAGDSFDEDCW